uniref:Uncharacterized protein n=1 Tax=Anguilla anguilla TaxID=7936 RepID=A0A0E9VSX8_ANGAN
MVLLHSQTGLCFLHTGLPLAPS